MPKSTEELYQELLAQGQQYQQQANDLLTQYDNRPAFSYNAATDPIYQSVRDQYVHQGQRAMEDTMGQAAGLTGGYGSSYSQSVGNQAYNEYLTKLNAQIPVLAQQARQAYDAEGQRMLDRYNLAMNAANTAYGQGRDALGDLRYEQETAYAHERDALADQRYQDELTYNRQQSELNSARDYATYLLGMGIMPSAQQLAAAGMTPQEAASIQSYYRNQMALAASGGSGSRSSSGGSQYTNTPKVTEPPEVTPPDGLDNTTSQITDKQRDQMVSYALQYGLDVAQRRFANLYPQSKYPNRAEVWDWIKQAYKARTQGRSTANSQNKSNPHKNLDAPI